MNIEYNQKLFKKINPKLMRVAITKLAAVGLLSIFLTACKPSDSFSYDNNSNYTFAEQVESYIQDADKDFKPSKELLKDFDNVSVILDTFDDYDSLEENKESYNTKVVSKGYSSLNDLEKLICDKIKLDINMPNAEVTIKDNGNSEDGPDYIIIVESDGVTYEATPSHKLFNAINLVRDGVVTTYSGSGKNWSEKDVEKFIKNVENTINDTITSMQNPVDLKLKEKTQGKQAK